MPNTKFMTGDIKNFYLNMPMDQPEYMKITLELIPDEIVEQYDLLKIAYYKGMVFVKINRGMYRLPQARIFKNNLLAKQLDKKGYYQTPHMPGLWTHVYRPIQFSLIVDDFGVKYIGREHAKHLMAALTRL
jgi:hypothetical protein